MSFHMMNRYFRVLDILPASISLLLLAGWFGFCYWCNSWLHVEPPAFHASWSEHQRADLLEMDNAMRYNPMFQVLASVAAEQGAAAVLEELQVRGILPAIDNNSAGR